MDTPWGNSESQEQYRHKVGLAEMLKGGVIMDVTNDEQAKIAEEAGAVAVMALERIPSDIRKMGGIARMSGPGMIQAIKDAVSIPVMAKAEHTSMLSLSQLNALAMKNPRDVAQVYSQKNFRITEPIINFITLMVSLPVLICRDPRSMKSAVLVSFSITSACLLMTFVCKMLSTETLFFSRFMPEFWAWLPVFIFLPIAFIELDAMKT